MAAQKQAPYADGRLQARPSLHASQTSHISQGDRADQSDLLLAGEHVAAGDAGWSGVLFVPRSYRQGAASPLMVTLHGAGSNGRRMLDRWRDQAESTGMILLAPDSAGRTWDVLVGGYGIDVARIDRALAGTFFHLNVDPAAVMVEGFSDGASYALSIGLANGDLFPHVIANSPGFCWPPSATGQPAILITHGTEDTVLPIDVTSRKLAPQLSLAGYAVTYEEFDGGHMLLPATMARSLAWAGLNQ